MDEVDSPFLRKKKSQQKQSDTRFQSELQMKLQQRRSEGLTYGLTSEESDSIVDDDDGDSDEGRLDLFLIHINTLHLYCDIKTEIDRENCWGVFFFLFFSNVIKYIQNKFDLHSFVDSLILLSIDGSL
jgi:hypothetical protein